MRRRLIAILAAGTMALMLMACSSDSGNSSAPSAAESAVVIDEEPVDTAPMEASDDGASAGAADLSETATLDGLSYAVDPAWTVQDTTSEMPASDGSGNLTIALRTYVSGNPADMNMLQVQAQQIDPAIAALLDTLDEETLKSTLQSMGAATTTTSTEAGDVTTTMASMSNPPAGARAAWTYTADYSDGVPMQGAEIVTDTHIYMISAVGTVTDIWPQIEATIALS